MATPVFDASVYGKYFTAQDPNALAWATNVLEKLYARGIVPKYILRQENTTVANAPTEDQDFLNFWKPLTIFWAYAVQLSRVFENFTGDRDLLREHLLERGYYPNNDQTLDKLVYMMATALRIRAERGTIEMYRIGDTEDSDSDSGAHSDGYDSDSDSGDPYIDGELLKLIQYRKNDFFQLGNPLTKFSAWNLSNYSPLHTGLTRRYDLNLGYEWTEDVENLNAYPLINPKSVVSYPLLAPTSWTDLVAWTSKNATQFTANAVGGPTDYESYQACVLDPGQSLSFTINFNIVAGLATLAFRLVDSSFIQLSGTSGFVTSIGGNYTVTLVNTSTASSAYLLIDGQHGGGAYNFTITLTNVGTILSTHTSYGCNLVDASSDSTTGDTLEMSSVYGVAGIGSLDLDKAVIIDPQLNFEITFQIRQILLTNNFTFGCLCFDQSNNLISLKSIVTGSNQQNFFTDQKLNKSDRFYFLRGIIYNSSHALLSASDALLNIGFGNQLKFPSNAKKIIPYIIADTSGGTTILRIWNLKMNVCSLQYNNVFTTGDHHIDLFIKSNNASYSRDQLYSILRKYFMPYNANFSITHLGL